MFRMNHVNVNPHDTSQDITGFSIHSFETSFESLRRAIHTKPMAALAPKLPGSGQWVILGVVQKHWEIYETYIISYYWASCMLCLSVPYISLYTYYLKRLLIKIPLSANGHSSRTKKLLSRTFRELHVYLSRAPCWATTPLMKICSPPAKLRQRSTDHFLIAIYGWSDLTMGVPAPSVAKNVKLLPAPGIWLNLRMPCLKRGVLQTLIAAGITESLLRTDCCFFARFTDAPSTCTLNFARSWKLGCCIWSLFLETSKSIIRQWQRQV